MRRGCGTEESGGTTTQEAYNDWYAPSARRTEYWSLSSPTRAHSGSSGTRSTTAAPATLQALRVEVGDDAFFAGAQLWLERYDDSTGTSEDFEAVYEEASGEDLDEFFDIWLRNPVKPPTTWTVQ